MSFATGAAAMFDKCIKAGAACNDIWQHTQNASTASEPLHETLSQVLGEKSQHATRSPTSSKGKRFLGATGVGGRNDGSSSDDEDSGKDVSQIWKQLQKESPCIKRYNGHKYVQSKCGKYWYSKDTAGHTGAAFKRYDDTGRSLRFRDSLDKKMRSIPNKHESRAGSVINKSDMIGVK